MLIRVLFLSVLAAEITVTIAAVTTMVITTTAAAIPETTTSTTAAATVIAAMESVTITEIMGTINRQLLLTERKCLPQAIVHPSHSICC